MTATQIETPDRDTQDRLSSERKSYIIKTKRELQLTIHTPLLTHHAINPSPTKTDPPNSLQPSPPHPMRIQPPMQLPLQIGPMRPRHLLRPRILITPRIEPLRNRHLLHLLALHRLRIPHLLRRAHRMPKPLHLVQNHEPHLGDLFHDLEAEVEGGGARQLVRGVVPDAQVAVLEGLLDVDAGRGVEGEHQVQEVQGVRVGAREELLEGDLGHVGQVADVFLGAGGADALQGGFGGRAEVVEDLVELVDVVAAFEEGFAA